MSKTDPSDHPTAPDGGNLALHLRGCADALRHHDHHSAVAHLTAVLDDVKAAAKTAAAEHTATCTDALTKLKAIKKHLAATPTPTTAPDAAHKASAEDMASKLDALASDASAGKIDWAALFAKLAALLPVIIGLFSAPTP